MMKPRLVIFDMDDVLCRYDLGKRLRVLSRLSGKTPRDIRAAIWDSGFEDDADSGRYATADQYLAEFGRRLGYPLSRDEWIDARRQAIEPNSEVLAFAKHTGLAQQILIYSNNGPLMKESLSSLFPEAHGIFGDRVYCSCEFKAKKPDPVSYTLLLDRLGARPDEAWFIDDKKSNIEGALLAGLQATQFVSYGKLEIEALKRGLTVPR
jgi:putative hydrolase of the HAD superfamily